MRGVGQGKKELKACVRSPNPQRKNSRRQQIRTFATTTNALLELRDWLVAEQVTLVVLEATGDYWRGVFEGSRVSWRPVYPAVWWLRGLMSRSFSRLVSRVSVASSVWSSAWCPGSSDRSSSSGSSPL